MKKLLLIFASLFFAEQTFANDSAISGTSGTPGNLKAKALAGEHKTVRMVSEQIEMRVGHDDYVTDARFVFHNSGPATTVRMGFPEGAGGDSDFEQIKKKTSFKEFETWVDGKRIKATRMISSVQNEEFDFDAFWVKSVRFARNQTRNVRVRYRSELGSTSDSSQYVFYDFTGGNWKGKVDESTLKLTFTVPGTYKIFPDNDAADKPFRRETNDEIFFRWRNWQAQEAFGLRYLRTLSGAMVWAEAEKDLAESGELSPDSKYMTVRGKRKFDPWVAQSLVQPSVILKDGRAFIQLRDLHNEMREDWERKNKRNAPKDIGMYSNGGLIMSPTYIKGAPLIVVTVGKKSASVGGRKLEFPAEPFVAGGMLYVPLVSIVEALGGKAKANAKTMRYWYEIPV